MNVAEGASEFLRREEARRSAWLEFQMLLLDHGATLGFPGDYRQESRGADSSSRNQEGR